MASLFDPLALGEKQLKNRIIMAPLTRSRANNEGRVPNQLMAEYYRQRASAGLILTEATSVTPMGVGYPDTPGIWSEAQTHAWKAVTQAVHEEGGRIFVQLWHVGRVSDPRYLGGELPVSASAIAAPGHVSHIRPKQPFVTPRALTMEEIENLKRIYTAAARNAVKAGFDGVELHAANGYLFEQFLYPKSNVRNDAYGGSLENRARLLLEILDVLISVVGEKSVGVHLSLSKDEAEDAEEAACYLAKQFEQRNVAFVFLREPQNVAVPILPVLRHHYSGVLIANQGLDRQLAEDLLARGAADAVSFGELFIANPDLVERFEQKLPLNTPDPNTYYFNGEKGYTDYPKMSD